MKTPDGMAAPGFILSHPPSGCMCKARPFLGEGFPHFRHGAKRPSAPGRIRVTSALFARPLPGDVALPPPQA